MLATCPKRTKCEEGCCWQVNPQKSSNAKKCLFRKFAYVCSHIYDNISQSLNPHSHMSVLENPKKNSTLLHRMYIIDQLFFKNSKILLYLQTILICNA